MFVAGAGEIGVVERDAGLLFAERSVMAFASRAMELGARIEARAMVLGIGLDGERVVVTTADARHEADQVVLALGPWWPSYAPLRAPLPLTVTRQVQCWVAPADRAAFRPETFPIFMRYAGRNEASQAGEADEVARRESDPLVYGLPEAHFLGLKLAVHAQGALCDPESVDREVDAEDLVPIRRFIERHLPGAAGPLLGARVCMYTNTPDGHFGLGPHPDDARVVCAMGFSGHGFKLAPSVGRLLADCVMGTSGEGPVMPGIFALDRFAAG
jgi:sarcosine oxidase